MVRSRGQPLGLLGAGEHGAPLRLGIQSLPVLLDRRGVLWVVVPQDIELPAGPVQVSGKQVKLEQEEPGGVVRRIGTDFLGLGLDCSPELASVEQLAGCHGRPLVRDQRSEIRSQKSEVRNQKSEWHIVDVRLLTSVI
jgi:hypothetical protein